MACSQNLLITPEIASNSGQERVFAESYNPLFVPIFSRKLIAKI